MALLELTQETYDAARVGWLDDAPLAKKKDRPNRIQVFKNQFIERWFGQAHPVTPILWFGPMIAYGIYRGVTGPRTGVLGTLGILFAGWLIWSLCEYLLHRFVFHWEPSKEEDKVKAFMLHGYHHVFPDDKMRLVAPPVMSWIPGILFGVVYYYTVGTHYWTTLYAGTAIGYVAYDWIHYYTHHARPKGGVGRWLRRYHMVHHHKFHNECFGVSSPLWDLVFGTYRSFKSTATTTGASSEERAA